MSKDLNANQVFKKITEQIIKDKTAGKPAPQAQPKPKAK